MIRIVLGVLVLGLAATCATTGLPTRESSEPLIPASIARPTAGVFTESTLPTGLRVLVNHDPSMPVVAISLAITADITLETLDKAGALSVLGQVLVWRTQGLDHLALSRVYDEIGESIRPRRELNGLVLGFFRGIPSEQVDQAIALLADTLAHPSFDRDTVAKARRLVRDDGRSFNKARLEDGLLFKEIFGSQDRRSLPQLFTAATVAAVGAEDLRVLYNQAVRPANMTLVLAGDVTPGQVQGLVERHFGSWNPKPPVVAPRPVTPVDAMRAPMRKRILVLPRNRADVLVQIRAPSLPAKHPLHTCLLGEVAAAEAAIRVVSHSSSWLDSIFFHGFYPLIPGRTWSIRKGVQPASLRGFIEGFLERLHVGVPRDPDPRPILSTLLLSADKPSPVFISRTYEVSNLALVGLPWDHLSKVQTNLDSELARPGCGLLLLPQKLQIMLLGNPDVIAREMEGSPVLQKTPLVVVKE